VVVAFESPRALSGQALLMAIARGGRRAYLKIVYSCLVVLQIPNPLFDLAGITCGHFLVPFWTFFGATLLGKAVIKMHIQKIFVIVAFNESLLEKAVALLGFLPVVGSRLQIPFTAFLKKQKDRLHRKGGDAQTPTVSAQQFKRTAPTRLTINLTLRGFYFLPLLSTFHCLAGRQLSEAEGFTPVAN